jgi:hypothetical protein
MLGRHKPIGCLGVPLAGGPPPYAASGALSRPCIFQNASGDLANFLLPLFQLSSNSLLTPLLVFPEGRKGHTPPRASAIHIAHLIPIPRLRPPQDLCDL